MRILLTSAGRTAIRRIRNCILSTEASPICEGANPQLYGGWPMVLSGLKTLLETGETLTTPGSLRYSQASPGPVGEKSQEPIDQLPGKPKTDRESAK